MKQASRQTLGLKDKNLQRVQVCSEALSVYFQSDTSFLNPSCYHPAGCEKRSCSDWFLESWYEPYQRRSQGGLQ